jgi:heterodisulfide reductase subunit B
VPVPTVYFTQLMGLAFGLPAGELGMHRSFVPMKPFVPQEATRQSVSV